MKPNTNPLPWGLAVILAVVVLGGSGLTVVRLRPYWVAGYRGVQAHLHGASLSHARLVAVDLRGADLSDTDLQGADLQRANLRGTNLRGATLRGAQLAGATIVQCDFYKADLRGAGLQCVKGWSVGWGWGVSLERADLTDANCSGANLQGAAFPGARLVNADLSRANLRGASFQWADLRGARLMGTDLRDVYLGQTRIEGLDVSDALYNLPPTSSLLGTSWPPDFDPRNHGAVLVRLPIEGRSSVCWPNKRGAKVLGVRPLPGSIIWSRVERSRTARMRPTPVPSPLRLRPPPFPEQTAQDIKASPNAWANAGQTRPAALSTSGPAERPGSARWALLWP